MPSDLRPGARLARRFGAELRVARVTEGLSQARLGGLVGVSQTMVSQVERAHRRPSWDLAAALAAAVGHSLSLKLYPSRSVSLRDSGQMEMAELIVGSAHSSWHVEIEAPISDEDRRAADVVLRGRHEVIHIEIERRLVDFQAQLRSAQLKRRDLAAGEQRPVRLVIALPATRAARRVLATYPALIGQALPIRSRDVWPAVRYASPLRGDGILLVPTRRRDRNGHP